MTIKIGKQSASIFERNGIWFAWLYDRSERLPLPFADMSRDSLIERLVHLMMKGGEQDANQ